jgi:hypothetical protein
MNYYWGDYTEKDPEKMDRCMFGKLMPQREENITGWTFVDTTISSETYTNNEIWVVYGAGNDQ